MKMKAMIVQKPGAADSFQMQEVPVPEMRPGHVLVRMKATSVNPIDMKVRSMNLPFNPPFPAILHGDFAGIVEQVAPDVKGFKTGDKVYGCGGGIKGTVGGALAEFLLVDAALTSLAPEKLSFAECAALPLVTITSWEALLDKMRIVPGSSVLIHGGVGGVGHIAAQIAKAFGAVVHTTVSSDTDAATSKDLGSDFPINYKTTTVDQYVTKYTGGRGFDFIFDTVGGPNLEASIQAARLNGSVACIATGGNHDLTTMYVKGVSLHSVIMLIPLMTGQGRAHYGNLLFEAKKLADQGRLRPLLHKEVFNWKDIGKAHALIESGKQRGKIVVEIA